MKFIIGLGNPGKNYENTRHNAGFRVINEIARIKKMKCDFEHKLFFEGEFKFGNETVILVQPKTFMNQSGDALSALQGRYRGLLPADLLVVIDDVNLPIGSIRLRTDGSAGGHNGLESVISALHTQNFPRLRIGVGREGLSGQDLTDFVLGKFEPSEEEVFKKVIPIACEACLLWVSDGAQATMNRYNKN